MNTAIALPFPWLPGQPGSGLGVTTDEFAARVQQNFDALSTTALSSGSAPFVRTIENVGLVRGNVNGATGALTAGTGFSVSVISTGVFQITYTTPFAGPATPFAMTLQTSAVYFFTTTGTNLATGVRIDASPAANVNFAFMAIGPIS